MKVVLLAGGLGTRISEESHLKPKPMIEIGEKPILWHIMKIYSHFNYNEFIICAGYKSHIIKEYFANYYFYNSDITYDFSDNNKIIIHNNVVEPWKVTIVDTGLETMTGGRLKRVRDYIGKETFMMTYGDGVTDLNIAELTKYHKNHGKMATMTCVQPLGRFGAVNADSNNIVNSFREKPRGDNTWINGGFFVLEPEILDYIDEDSTIFEKGPLERAAAEKQLVMYKHCGYWQCMDTIRDKNVLEGQWASLKTPWKVWG